MKEKWLDRYVTCNFCGQAYFIKYSQRRWVTVLKHDPCPRCHSEMLLKHRELRLGLIVFNEAQEK